MEIVWIRDVINDRYYGVCKLSGRICLTEKIDPIEPNGKVCQYADICHDGDCNFCDSDFERLDLNIKSTILQDFTNLVLMPRFYISNDEFLIELEVCQDA